MTLNTTVAIRGNCNPKEIFLYCRALLNTPDNVEIREGEKNITHPPGVGLSAWLMLHIVDNIAYDCDDSCDEYDCFHQINPEYNGWATAAVSFDTAYSYRGDNGESCSDLHARLITNLGYFLDQKGLEWQWQNEYTGEWFERFDQLDKFGNAHRATGADNWFRNIALPAIEREYNV